MMVQPCPSEELPVSDAPRAGAGAPFSAAATVPRLEPHLHWSLSEAAADWQQLKAAAHCSPYQGQEWLTAWWQAFGAEDGPQPVIAVGRIDGTPAVLLPLALRRRRGIATLGFLGQDHANQATGLWRRDIYPDLSAAQIAAFLATVCAQTGADLLKLQNIPRVWHGRPHPLLLPDAAPSPSPVFQRATGIDFDALFRLTHSKSARKNLQRKERHLREAGAFVITRARAQGDIARGLEAFRAQRRLRAAEAGIPNVFDTHEARVFLERLLGLHGETEEAPAVMDLWFLEIAGRIRSTCLCIEDGGTLYAYANSVAHDELLSNSPGLILIKEIFAHACASPEIAAVDLGLGEERYKTAWAEPADLGDSLLAITARGRLARAVAAARLRAKAAIRGSTVLWPLVRRFRKLKAGLKR